MPEQATGTCLGFDYGTRKIGMAVGNKQFKTSQPLALVDNVNGTPDWIKIDEQVETWRPECLIVGWPLTESGETQSITPHVAGFIKRLRQRYGIDVYKSDERYSSIMAQQANRRMRQQGQRKQKTRHGDIDMLAAAFILEGWYSFGSVE